MGEDRQFISIASKIKGDCITLKIKNQTRHTKQTEIRKQLLCEAHFSKDCLLRMNVFSTKTQKYLY